MVILYSGLLIDFFFFQHYLQLCQMTSQEEPPDCSNSDSSLCWTLPRNFRLRTVDTELEEEAEEMTPMLQPRERQNEESGKSESCDNRRLFRQHTISNPGYQMLMKRLKSSKTNPSKEENMELVERQSEPADGDNVTGDNSNLSSGYSTMTESQPNSGNSNYLLGYSTIPDTDSLLA